MRLNELEIKIVLGSEENFKQVFERCTQFFGPHQSHLNQLDEYFDTPDRQLNAHDLVVRIRSSNGKKTVALKSPRIENLSGTTNRIELEFLSANEENVHDQLLNQGLHAYEAAEKKRWTFIHNECEIVLDQLPFIGSFIEIEGPSEEAIQEIITLLSLSSFEVARQNYGELMKEKFRELQLPLHTICATFAKEKELQSLR